MYDEYFLQLVEQSNIKTDPSSYIDRLSTLFRATRVKPNSLEHPACPAIGQCWPVISTSCEKWADNVKISETSCRCIRFMVRCIGHQTGVWLGESVANLIVKLYDGHKHSCFLYLASVLIDEMGLNEQYTNGLVGLVSALSRSALDQLGKGENALRDNPDTVDDFFRMCLRLVQKVPEAFFSCEAAEMIISCATVAAKLDHRDANSSVCKFFGQLVDCASGGLPPAKELLLKHGPFYVQNVIFACIFDFPSYMIAGTAEILFDIIELERPLMTQWIENALSSLPVTNSSGSVTVTQEQVVDFKNQFVG